MSIHDLRRLGQALLFSRIKTSDQTTINNANTPTNSETRLIEENKAKSKKAKFWVVCAYFNPCNYERRRLNYEIFASHLRRQGVPLCTVEMASSTEMLQLVRNPLTFADGLNQYVPVISPDVLWAKECLLNIGVRSLPAACIAFCWADADLVWDTDDWADRTLRILCPHNSSGTHPVVIQPFARGTNMKKGEVFEDYKDKPRSEIGTCRPFGKDYADRPISHLNNGEPFKIHAGYAWAMRRDIFNQIGGLYEHCILGQADYVMAIAFSHNNIRDREMSYLWNVNATFNWSDMLQRHARKWQINAAAVVKGRLGYLPDVAIFHNEHGSPHDRRYSSRGALLNDYTPDVDITKNDQGALCFTAEAKRRNLPMRIKKYFEQRKEDGATNIVNNLQPN